MASGLKNKLKKNSNGKSETTISEKDLIQLHTRLEKIQRIASVGYWEMTGKFIEQYWSDEFYRIHGLKPRSVKPSTKLRLQMVHPHDRVKLQNAIDQALKNGKPYQIEKRIVLPDKKIRWVLSQGEVELDATTGKRKIFGTVLDITARKLEEIRRQEAEKVLNKAQKIASIGSWEMTDDNEVHWSDEFYRIHGLEPGKVKPSTRLRLMMVHKDDRPKIKVAIENAVHQGKNFSLEKRIVRPDGEIRWVLSQGEATQDPISGKRKITGTLLDITERKKAQAIVDSTHEHMRETLQFGKMGRAELNLVTQQLLLSEELLLLLEMPSNAQRKISLHAFFDQYLVPTYIPVLLSVIEKGQKPSKKGVREVMVQFEMITHKGRRIWINAKGVFKKDVAFGILQDVTEMKNVESEKLEKNRVIDEMLKGITDGFFATDRHLNFTMVNPTFEALSQFKSEEVIGKNMLELFPYIKNSSLIDAYEKAIETQQSESIYYDDHLNSQKYFQVNIYPNPNGLYVYFKDFSASIRIENELKKLAHQVTTLTDNIPDGFLFEYHHSLVNTPHRMHYISQGCEKVFGESVQQVLNDPKSILSKIHPEDIDQFKKVTRTEVERLGRFDVDYRIVLKDGSMKWIKGRASCRKLSDEVVVIEGIALDITRQKEMEFEQSRLALIASHTSNAVILTDVAGNITWVNDGFERITEYNRDEVIGKKPGDLLQGPNTDNRVIHRMSVALKNGEGFKEELLNYSKRGRPYWLEIEVMPVKDSVGKLTGFMAIENDITNLKNAILEMQRSESALHAFMNHAPMVAFIKDVQGRYTFYNKTYRDFMRGKELLAGYTDYDLFDKEFADLCVERDNHIIQTGELLIFEHQVGESIFMEYKFPLRDPYNKIFAVGGISLDITEKIEAQRKILDNEARLNSIIENLKDSVLFQYLVNEKGEPESFPFVSQGSIDLFEVAPDELENNPMKIFELVHTDDIPELMRKAEESRLTLQPFDHEYRIITPSGKLKWKHTRSVPRRLPNGKTMYDGLSTNITQRKLAEQELFQSQKYFESLVNSQSSFLIRTDLEGRYTFINNKFYDRFGLQSHDLIGTYSIDTILPIDHDLCRQTVRKCFESPGKVVPVTLRKPGRGNKVIWTEWEFVALQDDSGQLMGIQAVGLDATDRIESQLELITANTRLSMATKVANIGVWEWDLLTDQTIYDEMLYFLIGISPDVPMTYQKFKQLVIPEDHEMMDTLLNEAIKNRTEIDFVLRLIHQKTKQLRYFQVNGITEYDANGRPLRMFGVDHDITDRYMAENLLRESEKRFRLAAQVAQIGVYEWDVITNKTYFDSTARKIFRMESVPEEDIFPTWYKGLHHEDLVGVQAAMDKTLSIGEPHELVYRWSTPLGQQLFIHVNAIAKLDAQGKVIAVTGVATDITEEKIASDKLRESEERFRSLVRDIDIGVILQGPKAEIKLTNSAALGLLGLTEDQLLGRTSFSPEWNVIRDDGSEFHGHEHPVPSAIQTKTPVRGVVMGVYRPAHRDRVWLLVDAIPRLNQRDEIEDVICTFNNITELKEAERNLQFTRFTIDHSSDPVFWIRSDGTIADMNPAAHDSLGYSYDEMLFTNVTDLHFVLDEHWESHWEKLRERKTLNFDSRLLCKNGSELEVEINSNLIVFRGQEFNCSFVRDISERKKYERDLLASNREKDMLIKEIHHRVKNNLQLISSVLFIRMKTLEMQSEWRDFLEEMRQKIRSIALIHERLLQTGSVNEVEISDYLGKLIKDLHMSNDKQDLNLSIQTNIQPEMLNLDVAIYCGLIINELITNSLKHAFKGRSEGTISIEFGRTEKGHQLMVKDNGITIDESMVIGKSDSFGLQLIDIFVRQLRGHSSILRNNGTAFLIEF